MNEKQNNERNTMSAFCEELMGKTDSINGLQRLMDDAAIILCSDGKTVASRQCGLMPNVVRMLYAKMVSDDKFAEVIIEASMRYSRYMTGLSHKIFKEDTPINKTIN